MAVRFGRWWWAIAVIAGLLSAPALAVAAPAGEAAQRLADAYAPVMKMREQQDPPCDTDAEQYDPTSVDTVLGNPAVVLQRDVPGQGLRDVKRAPTAQDLAGLGAEYYLDLNGDPLGETCVYSRDFEALKAAGGAPFVTYAHIAREAGHSGFALQYWTFWYFNQFNDLHEADWEGLQITFDADSPEQALEEGPSEIILFQHAGGERASWDAGKVQKEGTHPVVYPAAGSHATFYSSAVYVENGDHGSGLGCDKTVGPLRTVHPEAVLLPERATGTGPFAWLAYDGQWGQQEKGFNNGPTGPRTKTQWSEPFSWMADQRTSSLRMPGSAVVGPQVAEAFCSTIAFASNVVNTDARSRPLAIAIALLPLVAVLALFGITRWRPVDLTRLRARRSFGQLVRAARQLYGRHWRVLVPIALTAIPIVGGTNLLGHVLGGDTKVTVGGTAGSSVASTLGDLIQALGRPVASAIVAAVVVVFVRLLVETGGGGFAASWRGMGRRFWRVVLAQLGATLGVVLLAISVIGLPWAIWKLVGWRFVQQEVLFTDKSIREAFRGSSDLVRGRWWHTVRTALFLTLVTAVTGPVLTIALFFTSLPLIWINVLGAVIFSLLIPYVAIGNTLLYFDLEERAATEPAPPRRSWAPWRPGRFGRVVPAPAPSA
jgi:hypothetical protein